MMSRRSLVLLLILGLLVIVAGAGYVLWPRSYPTMLSFCPDGATQADLTIYHRSALDGHVERVQRPGMTCDIDLTTHLRDSGKAPDGLDRLPLTMVVATAGGKEQRTALYRLPGAGGYFVQQRSHAGVREDRTWDLMLDDGAQPVDAAELPTIS